MSKKDHAGGPDAATASPLASPTPAKTRSKAPAKGVVKLEKKLAALTRRQAKLRQRIAAAGSRASRGASPVSAYCMHDKMRVEIVGPERTTMKNGRSAVTGTCPTCGGKVMRMVAAPTGG